VAQERFQRSAIVNMIIDYWISQKTGNHSVSYDKWAIKFRYCGRKGSLLNVRYYFSITFKR